MISVIDNEHTKGKCQIFTPDNISTDMLDLANYKEQLYGKKILENSCGDGEFLVKIVSRYIEDALDKKIPKAKIKKGLEQDITAFDIDGELVALCKNKLDQIALRFGLSNIQWNIKKEDFLAFDTTIKYDFIIGNPPYIAYPDLPEEIQKFVRNNFDCCKKGKFDYSYAFIEKSYKLLKTDGILVYIIPSNIFKNVFAKELRALIQNDIIEIVDFPTEKIFKKALVSPAIIKIKKGVNSDNVLYTEHSPKQKNTFTINKTTFKDKWVFNSVHVSKKSLTTPKNSFKVSSTVATLLNEAFVFIPDKKDDEFYYIGENRIEFEIARTATSPKSKKSKKKQEYIIFPYHYDQSGKLMHYSEKEFYEKYPMATAYLSKYKEKLKKRKADKTAKWFEYGRSQALQHMNQRKILISSVISECTEAYILDANEIPFSGLYIVTDGSISLDIIAKELNSKAFKSYIKSVGVCVSGTSKRITPSDIENFISN